MIVNCSCCGCFFRLAVIVVVAVLVVVQLFIVYLDFFRSD